MQASRTHIPIPANRQVRTQPPSLAWPGSKIACNFGRQSWVRSAESRTRPWSVEDGVDLKDFFYAHINPTLGDLEVLTPDYCTNYINATRGIQTPWPWPPESREALFAAVGTEIGRFLAENDVTAYSQDVILTVFVSPPPEKPAASSPIDWVFRGGLSRQLTPEFSARLQADLEAKLPDLLRRFVSNDGALRVRPDAFTHCFRKDWIPGTRRLVTIARLRSSTDRAAVTS